MQRLIRLDYISDLHLERRTNFPKIKARGEYLALCGDIGNPKRHNYKDFLKYTADNWKAVFLIAGNHEYAGAKDLRPVNDLLRQMTMNIDNVHFLNDNHYGLPGLSVLGTTLWTVTTKPESYERSKNWLEQSLKLATKRTLVLTHHLPSYRMIHHRYHTKNYIQLHHRYANDLDYLISKDVAAWICGHSHGQYVQLINGVYVGINAVGSTEMPEVVTIEI